ncbi:hypothetical protein [Enterococcus termitis]|uniref:Uncharacterized protein n=1 Tax=Enterococcus termitis TaxID=332950 RepID=A0A1E5GB44_9ENTE|nr:hypothetical protein [Enterococcus termitis]OEG09871.1 hypothetical protein BCR25_10230 [Enterococcus termitis]OJG98378.1 hypothetical protein RV18_GL003279 [Enterococcus termitis]
MSVSKKLKRKIIFNDNVFYWYVGKDPFDKYVAKALHIVSADKSFLIVYRLSAVTEGSVFPKLEIIKSNYIKPGFYDLNRESNERTVTPKLVESILMFCLRENNK